MQLTRFWKHAIVSPPCNLAFNVKQPYAKTVEKHNLTWNSTSESPRLYGEQSLSQFIMSAVGWTNQGDGTFAVGRLMVQCHLLIGQNILTVML